MKPEKLLLELESLCEQAGYSIRKERGSFRGDHCIMEGEKLILVNKNRPADFQAAILAKVLRQVDTEDMFIKPAVRRQIREIWDRLDRGQEQREQENGVES
ncbi:MAG: hypothetical protein WDZ29_02595 [Balneolaceae bacterium]